MKLLNSAPARKGKAALSRLPRVWKRLATNEVAANAAPPILVNSLPKSGTHLLMQLVCSIGAYRNYGSFIATTPTISMRRRSPSRLASMVSNLVPGEVCGGHLFFAPEIQASLNQRNAISLFIYRDPRDVFWSEMQYLLTMNRWHRAGRVARSMKDSEEQFAFFLFGSDRFPSETSAFYWPKFATRVGDYLGWISDPNTLACRYETIRNPQTSSAELHRIANFIHSRADAVSKSYSCEALGALFSKSIRPEKSHTFRSGANHEWKTKLTPDQLQLLNLELSDFKEFFEN